MIETFFPRGNGPLVSILLPTRGRPAWMAESIYSIHDLARDHTRLEFILKVDDDDLETVEAVGKLKLKCKSKILVTPRGNGYKDMHLWVNQMSQMAEGDWLYLWNDDARMATKNWDEILSRTFVIDARRSLELMLLVTPVVGRLSATEFMFLRRKVFEVLGHWSLCPHNDIWIHSVMSFIGAAYPCDIQVEHYHGMLDDDTWKEVRKHYDNQSDKTTGFSEEHTKARLRDAEKLVEHFKFIRPA